MKLNRKKNNKVSNNKNNQNFNKVPPLKVYLQKVKKKLPKKLV